LGNVPLWAKKGQQFSSDSQPGLVVLKKSIQNQIKSIKNKKKSIFVVLKKSRSKIKKKQIQNQKKSRSKIKKK